MYSTSRTTQQQHAPRHNSRTTKTTAGQVHTCYGNYNLRSTRKAAASQSQQRHSTTRRNSQPQGTQASSSTTTKKATLTFFIYTGLTDHANAFGAPAGERAAARGGRMLPPPPFGMSEEDGVVEKGFLLMSSKMMLTLPPLRTERTPPPPPPLPTPPRRPPPTPPAATWGFGDKALFMLPASMSVGSHCANPSPSPSSRCGGPPALTETKSGVVLTNLPLTRGRSSAALGRERDGEASLVDLANFRRERLYRYLWILTRRLSCLAKSTGPPPARAGPHERGVSKARLPLPDDGAFLGGMLATTAAAAAGKPRPWNLPLDKLGPPPPPPPPAAYTPPPAMVVVPLPLLQGVSVDAAMLRPTCDQVLRKGGADGSMSTAVSPPPPPPTCTGGGKEGSRPNRGRPNGGG
ncbi:unnamed protein product, partial [Ectocarpus sp. 6 AP-2014]